MSNVTIGIMDRLREGTKALHDAAEGHGFQQSLFAGKLPRESYIAYLGQMWLLYGALEDAIRDAQRGQARIAEVVQPHNYRGDDLARDLSHFGADTAEFTAVPATRTLIDEIDRLRRDHPIALLGMHYVLEGSNNGNHFIAKNIRKAYDLDAGGATFLDPYGEAQRPRWAEYKEAMAGLSLTDDESDAILAAAQEMFRAIGKISEELHTAQCA